MQLADSAGHSSGHGRRPHADHSRRGQGRRIHAAVVLRAGRAGDPAVPAQHSGHAHSRRRGAAVAAGRDRHHLSCRLQPGQSVADGADDRRRLRGRRRHRRRREHFPSSRSRHDAAAIGDQGRARNRLHRAFDQHFADRGLHPAVADERHRRPAVPRIRHHGDRRDRGVGRRVADVDADAVLALSGQRARPRTRPALSHHRTGLRCVARRLSPRPRLRVAPSIPDAARVPGDGHRYRRAVRDDSKGFLPDPGHRHDVGHFRRPARTSRRKR